MPTVPRDWEKVKTVAELVKVACASYRHGACIYDHACRLTGETVKPCRYFEESVLPAAPPEVIADYAVRVKRTASERGAGVVKAWLAANARYCDCGEALRGRERRCPKCRETARRATRRQSQARWREKQVRV